MKNSFLLLFSFLLFLNILFAQGSFSYKRQLSYKQCMNCDCKKSRSYKILSKNLTVAQRNCAQNDVNASLTVKELFQSGTSGGLFGAYNLPQEGCGDDCYHDFEYVSDDVEEINLEECLTDSQKQKIKDQKQREEDERNNKIKQLLESGKYYYEKEELRNAIYYYNQVLSIDKNNYEAYNKKSEIENFFYNRAAGYQYRKLFESNYNYFVEKLKIALEDEISKTENGQAKFTIDILFDTSGINKSTISKTNITDLDNRISSIVNTWLSTKPTKKGYYVNAFDKITVDVSWKSGNSIYTRNSKGSTTFNATGSEADHFKFIKSLDYPFGKFYFTSKAKKLIIDGTEVKATDILFTKYEFSGGPLNAFYSVLFPGLGKYKVTNGIYGIKTMIIYGASMFLYSVFKINEIVLINKYYKQDFPNELNEIYQGANNSRVIGLLSLFTGISTGIYDLYFSVTEGFSNIKSSKKTKGLLKLGENYVVQKQKL